LFSFSVQRIEPIKRRLEFLLLFSVQRIEPIKSVHEIASHLLYFQRNITCSEICPLYISSTTEASLTNPGRERVDFQLALLRGMEQCSVESFNKLSQHVWNFFIPFIVW